MDNSDGKVKDSNIESNDEDIAKFKKYVIKNPIIYYNTDNLIDKDNYDNLICAICLNILKNPRSCSEKNNVIPFVKNV